MIFQKKISYTEKREYDSLEGDIDKLEAEKNELVEPIAAKKIGELFLKLQNLKQNYHKKDLQEIIEIYLTILFHIFEKNLSQLFEIVDIQNSKDFQTIYFIIKNMFFI